MAAASTQGSAPDAIFQRYVAYVSKDNRCKGTGELRRLMKPIQEDVMIVEVENLSRRDVPTWLKGTPCLVDLTDGKRVAYHGSDAVRHMDKSVQEMNMSSAPSTLEPASIADESQMNDGFGAASEAEIAPIGERPGDSREDNDRDALEAAVMREQEARANAQPRMQT